MRKIISCLMAVIMLLSLNITAFAADTNLTTQGATGTSTVEYVVDSSYIVVIPEFISGNGDLCLTAQSMKLLENQQVNVYCDDLKDNQYVSLTNSANGESVNFRFSEMRGTNCVAAFLNGEMTSNFSVFGEIENSTNASPGTYTGTVTFSVLLVDKDNYQSY